MTFEEALPHIVKSKEEISFSMLVNLIVCVCVYLSL